MIKREGYILQQHDFGGRNQSAPNRRRQQEYEPLFDQSCSAKKLAVDEYPGKFPELSTMMTVRVSRSVYRLRRLRSPCLSLSSHLRLMSSDAIAKLPSPLKDLVAASVADSSGGSAANPKVNEWIEMVARGHVGKAESLKVRFHCRFGCGRAWLPLLGL